MDRRPTATTGLIDGAELAARAELTWLDEVAKRLVERYGSASTA